MSHIFTTFVSWAMALRWLRSFSAPLKWKSGRRSAARAARMFTNNRSRIAAGGTKSIGLSLFHEGIGGLTYVISACIPPSDRLTEILIQKPTVYKLLVKGSSSTNNIRIRKVCQKVSSGNSLLYTYKILPALLVPLGQLPWCFGARGFESLSCFFPDKKEPETLPPCHCSPFHVPVTRAIWPFPSFPLSRRAPGHRTISNDSGAKPIPMRTSSKLKVVRLQGNLAVESDPMKFHKHGTESCFKYLQICCSLGHWELEAVLCQQRMPLLQAFPVVALETEGSRKKHGQGTPAGFTFFSHKASCSCSK